MAKKITTFLMTALLIFTLVGCGNNSQQAESNSTQGDTAETDTSQSVEFEKTENDGKTLVVYFSWSTSGNTEKMATYIQSQTGADILELQPANPYPTDYNETGDVAKVERDENARPEIANLPDSISEYETIFVGYHKMEYSL